MATATVHDEITAESLNLMEKWLDWPTPWGCMTNSHHTAFAKEIVRIHEMMASVGSEYFVGEPLRSALIELITARLAMVMAKDSNRFDSFEFAKACVGPRATLMAEKSNRAKRRREAARRRRLGLPQIEERWS